MCNICVISMKDDIIKVEIIWVDKIVSDNYSFRLSDGIGDIFRVMFSNFEIFEIFLMSRIKLLYVIGYGIGFVFKEEFIFDVRVL